MNALHLTIVEVAKAYDLKLYEYLKFLLENRPSKTMADAQLANHASWSEIVQALCKNKTE